MQVKQSIITQRSSWNTVIKRLPGSSILQTWEWGQVKSAYGWDPSYLMWTDDSGSVKAAALVLIKTLPVPGVKTAYVPQGPLLNWGDKALYKQVVKDLAHFAWTQGTFSIKIDPEVILSKNEKCDLENISYLNAQEIIGFLTELGFKYSPQQIQFKNTAWLELDRTEEDLLSAMKQKTRYNIRLAGRKGVTIREGTAEDSDLLYDMYLETSQRDGFIIRPRPYYQSVWRTFMTAGMAVPLIAEVNGEAVAGLILFHFGDHSWYLYGMSRSIHREKMPNYLLQWEAIRLSKKFGCQRYDLWGAPETFDESDSMWGVYRFKKGLGAVPIQRIGAYDLPVRKNTYKIFIEIIPRVQSVLRKIRRGQQAQELDGQD